MGEFTVSYKSTGSGQDERRDLASSVTVAVERLSLPEIDSFIRRVFTDPVRAPSEIRPQLRRDYETALNLLQRASDAVPVLMDQCHRLEDEVQSLRTKAQADLSAANEVTDQWHQLAMALKAKVDENDAEMAGLRQRIELAEQRLAAGQQHTHAVQQQATVAIGITTLFHDKIVEAFGVGSQAHAALDRIAKGGLEPGSRKPAQVRDRSPSN